VVTKGAPARTLSQVVVVNLRLSDQRCGTAGERLRLAIFEGELVAILGDREDMMFEGRDIGEGYCSFYCSGSDAAILFTYIERAIARYGPAPGSYVDLTDGRPIGISGHRKRIDLR